MNKQISQRHYCKIKAFLNLHYWTHQWCSALLIYIHERSLGRAQARSFP